MAYLEYYTKNKFLWGKIYLGDLFSKKVTKRRPIWAKSLLWRLSILKGDPFGNTAFGDEGTLNVEEFQKTTLRIPELSIHKDHSEVSMKPNPAI